jgi:hypothetical protein
MLSFERQWKEMRDFVVQRNGQQSPSQIADLAKDIIAAFGRRDCFSELQYVQCATLHYRGD